MYRKLTDKINCNVRMAQSYCPSNYSKFEAKYFSNFRTHALISIFIIFPIFCDIVTFITPLINNKTLLIYSNLINMRKKTWLKYIIERLLNWSTSNGTSTNFLYNVHDMRYSLRLRVIETLDEQIYRLNIRSSQSKGALYIWIDIFQVMSID